MLNEMIVVIVSVVVVPSQLSRVRTVVPCTQLARWVTLCGTDKNCDVGVVIGLSIVT